MDMRDASEDRSLQFELYPHAFPQGVREPAVESAMTAGPLDERLQFEYLISDLSAAFLNVAPDRVEEEAAGVLGRVSRFFGADHCSLLEVLRDRKQVRIVSINVHDGGPREALSVDAASGPPWAYHRLVEQGEPVIFSSLDELPPEAGADRAAWEREDVRALLMLPLRVGGQVTQLIGLSSHRTGHEWPAIDIRRLRLVGDILLAGVIHKHAHEPLRMSEQGLADVRRLEDGAIVRNGELLDITARKQVEAEAAAREQRLSMALEAAGMVTWEWDIPTRSVRYSEEIRVIARGEAVAPYCSLDTLLPEIHPDDRSRLTTALERTMTEGQPFECEYRVHMLDGTYRWILGKGKRVIVEDGKPVRVLGVSLDITERKQAEKDLRTALDEIQRYKEQLEAENLSFRQEVGVGVGFSHIVGTSDEIEYVKFRVRQVAQTKATALLTGETGTGKGVFARALHEASNRKGKPFVHVNCAGLPPNLIESELFGREKGAFTGSTARQIGRFELANGGTIYLDEIGELPPELQAKLLKVLEDGEFERLGSPHPVKVDVRVVASTNRQLEDEVKAGRFRKDLFYRLNVFPVTIPPLRRRREDIQLLANFYVHKFGRSYGKVIKRIPKEIMTAFETHSWPGNVRELINVVERAVIVSDGPVLRLAEQITTPTHLQAPSANTSGNPDRPDAASLARIEHQHILQTLQETGWRIEGPRGAAQILQMHPSTVRARMKKLGIVRPNQPPRRSATPPAAPMPALE